MKFEPENRPKIRVIFLLKIAVEISLIFRLKVKRKSPVKSLQNQGENNREKTAELSGKIGLELLSFYHAEKWVLSSIKRAVFTSFCPIIIAKEGEFVKRFVKKSKNGHFRKQ